MYTAEDHYRYKNVGREITKAIKSNEGRVLLNILKEGSAIFRSSNFMRYNFWLRLYFYVEFIVLWKVWTQKSFQK